MKTPNLVFNKEDKIEKDEFDPKNIKIRVTTFIDLDILEALKKEAARSGKKYQTLLNEKLRKTIFEEESIKSVLFSLEKRLTIVERKIKVG
jgi:uncharacterized protein (DUF4415 family)